MLSRRRLPWIVAFPAMYVGALEIRAGESRPTSWLLILVAIAVALVGGRIPEGVERGPARMRFVAAAGLSVTIATAALSTRPGWAAIAREIAAFVALAGAFAALGAIDGDVGLAPKATDAEFPASGIGPRNIVRAGLAVATCAWGIAFLADATAWARRTTDSDGAAWPAATAGAIALFALGGTALLLARVRRLELVVPPRALVCAGAAAAGLVSAISLGLSNTVAPDAAAALGSAIAAALVVRLAQTRDALGLAKQGRRALTLIVFGGPAVALAAISVESRTLWAGGAALVLGGAALLIGALAEKLEEPFLPVKGILLEALADARDAAREREARAAMSHALVRIREACAVGLGPTAAPSPELWLLHPSRVMTVNAAGYLLERPAELPAGLFDVALGEPHATLQTDVLRALEVRRADLRPLLAWLQHRDALFATVIAESDDPDGLLIVPAGGRTEDLTLEEARAAKLVADAFVAVSQAASAKVRHLERERALTAHVDELDDEIARLKHGLDLEVGRHTLAATRLARPATVGIYSAVSRMAYEALEGRIGKDAPTVIVARAGIDQVPYVARAHLSGPRKTRPLVVVEGTSTREHDLGRWSDERTSPLALADGGLLFLVDGAALPRDVQVLVARAVAERRPPWERATPLDVAIALGITSSITADMAPGLLEALVDANKLASELASRFAAGDPIVLPGLHERPEDLRSIVADHLAREGLRVLAQPVGIEAAAFGRLVEYAFEGEDAELDAIVTKLVARVAAAGTDVVRAADVASLALTYEDELPDLTERRRAGSRT